jgi:serine O-acetyltransferase
MTDSSKSNINTLVSAIVDSYEAEPDLIKIEDDMQIDPEVITEIINDLKDLIFAGFYDKRKLRADSVEYYVGELLERLIYNLQKQIARALAQNQTGQTAQIAYSDNFTQAIRTAQATPEQNIKDPSEEKTFTFLSRIPQLRSILATDVDAALDGDPAAVSKQEVILSYPGIYAITVSRLAHELWQLGVPLIPRMMTEHAHSITGIDIHPGASIGHHFFLDHGTGIVIGETTIIGNFVKIYQGVTLGALSTRGGQLLAGTKRHPTIEDHVTIYSGASILGGTTVIGEGVVIGSNAFITKSVPEKTRVSVRNPELQFRTNDKTESVELEQDEFWVYMI